ncbi:hypothetical protein H6P81_002292 [Aristolochia fimbriata]|uniref:Uncharacterized protein n=1 Tax=Aristolochia fimbriata TaxID=158543 RepID=A0AAV7F9X7_ARIFI|nr:hypothetical protein H6P81_002292 [Aristolochia fimbriata]
MEKQMQTFIDVFEAETKDAERVQREVLERILKENGEAEYLKKFGLDGKWDEETFRKCVPLASHHDLMPYINRIADGDASPLLAAKPFTALSWSSGTTGGKPKLVPFNLALSSTVTLHTTCLAYALREFSVTEGMFLRFLFISPRHKSKGGLDIGPVSSHLYYQSSSEMKGNEIELLEPCNPKEVAIALDYRQSLYCYFLCGLLHRDQIRYFEAFFCNLMVEAFRAFESIWEELCGDIREGVLSDIRVSDPVVRESVSKLLKPDPGLADSIYQKCKVLQSENWYGLIPELWPQAKFVTTILTGSMEAYVGKLRHYAGDKFGFVSRVYGSSEGLIAINIRPPISVEYSNVYVYAACPSSVYLEFIPLKRSYLTETKTEEGLYEESDPVRLTEVKVGEIYEIVITNYAGLYRYRLGDIVKVTGLYNSSPELQFLHRKNVLLNISVDKTTERDLQLVMEEASELLLTEEKAEIVDYTSYADSSTEPGHYVIFWELTSRVPSKEILQKCCSYLDQSLPEPGYITARKSRWLDALELRIVAKGTFGRIAEHYQSLGSTIVQFKTPRCIAGSNARVLQILDDNVSARFFSTAYA